MEITLNGIKQFINLNKEIKNLTVLQGVLLLGYEIPRFCYHEKLSIAGNCRMCLIEISNPKNLKPCASCALSLSENMILFTNTVLVKKAREGVLEFLLVNHPLDCPICDQGGECDLQDQSLFFGSDRGRFYEDKRAVEDKECGPFIKTVMTRCIHCTRCIRFLKEVSGHFGFGILGRGNSMEIGSYIQSLMFSEISGNVIDLCPVGALTSKPYAFTARPWELRNYETIDVTDSFCSRIRVDLRGFEVMRILPSINEELNENWILDRIRFCYDSFNKQRLYYPLVQLFLVEKKISELIKVGWLIVFFVLSLNLYYFFLSVDEDFIESEILPDDILFSTFLYNNSSFLSFFGDLIDNETLIILADFLWYSLSDSIFSQDISIVSYNSDIDFRSNYLLNLNLSILEVIDFGFFFYFNPRLEMPLLNLRLRKAFLNNYCIFFSNQFLTNLTYSYFQQGNNHLDFLNFFKGKTYASKNLLFSFSYVFLLGFFFVKNFSNIFFSHFCFFLIKYTNFCVKNSFYNINYILSSTSEIFSREIGLNFFISFSESLIKSFSLFPKFFYFCNNDYLPNFLFCKNNVSNFLLYQGHTGSLFLSIFDVILPGCNFLEKESFYVNLQGKYQKTKLIMVSPKNIQSDWFMMHCFRTFFYGFSYFHFYYLHLHNYVYVEDYMFFNRIFDILSVNFTIKLNNFKVRNLSDNFLYFFYYIIINKIKINFINYNYKFTNFVWIINFFNHYTKNLIFFNSNKVMEVAFLFNKRQQNFVSEVF